MSVIIPWAVRYTVFEDGRIVGPRGRTLRPDTSSGYARILIYPDSGGPRRRVLVNRLVCELFQGPAPSPTHHAAHRDGNQMRNTKANLRWATAQENEADKRRHGNMAVGERNGFTSLTATRVLEIRQARRASLTFTQIGKRFGVSRSTAFNVCAGLTWGHVS